MKQTLLYFLFLFFIISVQAEISPVNGMPAEKIDPIISTFQYDNINVFPNPAIDFFSLTNDKNVEQIVVINMVGRKMRTFEATSGGKYQIGDLPNGMYLIQFRDSTNKIITTQRISKR